MFAENGGYEIQAFLCAWETYMHLHHRVVGDVASETAAADEVLIVVEKVLSNDETILVRQ